MIDLLIEKGIDINSVTHNQINVLDIACSIASLKLIKYLMTKGAKFGQKSCPYHCLLDPNVVTGSSSLPVNIKFPREIEETFMTLIQAGIPVDQVLYFKFFFIIESSGIKWGDCAICSVQNESPKNNGTFTAINI